ncbi:MAG: cyanophycin synthetase [Chloroflexi bacterium]|nr:cyanophycin synthetase [Chloroflexota bacterium]
MRILNVRVYRGPNIYAHRTMIRMEVDLGELEEHTTDKLPGFSARLLELVPTLQEHRCSYGEAGGFVRRMAEGTWLGHVLEHVAIELQCLAGTVVSRGAEHSTGQYGHYYIAYEYRDEEVGREAGYMARDLIEYLLPAEIPGIMTPEERAEYDFHEELQKLIRLARDKALGPSTAGLVAAAEARGVPWIRLNEGSLVQFGHGKYQKRIEATITSLTSNIAVSIAQDKDLTTRLLRDAGLPVPRNILVEGEDAAVRAALDLGFPVVTKPFDGNHGRGVSIDLRSEEEVRAGYALAREESRRVIVEQFLVGNDHRILVINGKVAAVAERVPGHVVGDGQHSIEELIEITNRDPRRGLGHEKTLTYLELDTQAQRLIEKAGCTPQTVLKEGERFMLRLTGNLSTGGTAIDRTDVIHPVNARIATRAVQTVGLDIGGVDMIAPDISKPVTETGGGIVEINAAPGFRMHLAPSEGQPRDVGGAVIDMLFPPQTPVRIPICAITGTNGKTTTTRMCGHIMRQAGYQVGMTTTDGIYVDGEMVLRGDMTGPWSTRAVLREPTVDCAVLEVARGGIIREGLGYDKANVGCVLNVQADHLGLGGVNTIEDLARVKQVVAEAVVPGGWTVLNADNPHTRAMQNHTDGAICWFTLQSDEPLVRAHIADGGRALLAENDSDDEVLVLYDKGIRQVIMPIGSIPATYGGSARFNVANALAAAAVTYCMGATLDTIRQGLASFIMTYEAAPGRMNVYEQYPFRVIVDYAHNPAAMNAMREFLQRLEMQGRRIALLSAPGDRRDEDIRELARIAAETFDYVIFRDDRDRRGRAEGEMPRIMYEAALATGKTPENVEIVLQGEAAVQHALDLAQPGDLVMLFAENISGTWDIVTKYGESEAYRQRFPEAATALESQPVPPVVDEHISEPMAVEEIKEAAQMPPQENA